MVPYLTPAPVRKKAPPFQEAELRRLIAMYSASYSRYHAKLQPGVKWASSDKNRLLEKWSQYLTSMGVAPRTKAQIEEKLRNEVKRIHRFFKAENGKGRSERFPLPSYLDPLVRILSRNRSIDGTPEKEDLSIDLQEIAKEEINSSDEELADGPLFEPERKPTLDELLTHNSERWSRTDKVSTTQRGTHENHAPEAATTSAKVIGTLPKASLTGEVLSCFSDSLSQLLDEEVKLAKIRQEEAAMAIEVRRLEIEKLNLEIEWLRKRADSEASNGLCSPYYIQ